MRCAQQRVGGVGDGPRLPGDRVDLGVGDELPAPALRIAQADLAIRSAIEVRGALHGRERGLFAPSRSRILAPRFDDAQPEVELLRFHLLGSQLEYGERTFGVSDGFLEGELCEGDLGRPQPVERCLPSLAIGRRSRSVGRARVAGAARRSPRARRRPPVDPHAASRRELRVQRLTDQACEK